MALDAGSLAPVPLDLIERAPKVLLHDHLDGGLRPQTVIDLARAAGYGKEDGSAVVKVIERLAGVTVGRAKG